MSTPLFSDKVAEIFVKVDDFCNIFEHEFKKHSLAVPSTAKRAKQEGYFSRL